MKSKKNEDEPILLYVDEEKRMRIKSEYSKVKYQAERVVEILTKHNYEVNTANLRAFLDVRDVVTKTPLKPLRECVDGTRNEPVIYANVTTYHLDHEFEKSFLGEILKDVDKLNKVAARNIIDSVTNDFDEAKAECFRAQTVNRDKSISIDYSMFEVKDCEVIVNKEIDNIILEQCRVYCDTDHGKKILSMVKQCADMLQKTANEMNKPYELLDLFAMLDSGYVGYKTKVNYNEL